MEEWRSGGREKNIKKAPWLYAGRLKTINSRIVLYRIDDLAHRIRDLAGIRNVAYGIRDLVDRIGGKPTPAIPNPKCC